MSVINEYEIILYQAATKKFWTGMVIQDSHGLYYFYERWGKSPLEGQSTRVQCSRTEAIKIFLKKFEEKTGYPFGSTAPCDSQTMYRPISRGW